MSKDAYIYNNVNGAEAYLAGVVEGNTENYLESALHCKITSQGYGVTFVSDVYGIGENNELTLQQAIKKRMDEKCFDLFFDKGDVPETTIARKITALKITKLDTDVNTAITNLVKMAIKEEEADKIREDIEGYTTTLEWYLGKPTSIYAIDDVSGLFSAYLYIIFGIIVIEYDGYAVMLGIGTDD